MNFEKATIFTVAEMGTLAQLKEKLKSSNFEELNSNGESLLHMAIRGKKAENIDYILELIKSRVKNESGEIDKEKIKYYLNIQTKNGETPLAYLVSIDDMEFVLKYAEKLLSYGADINIKDSWGNNAFWTAVLNCDYEDYSLIKLMAKYKPDIKSKNNVGRSVIDIAEEDENEELLSIFKSI